MDNLDIKIWSESFWTMIESILVRYNAENHLWLNDVKTFFVILPRILPCQECGMHLIKYNYKYPITSYLTSQVRFFFWLYNLRKSMGFKYTENEYVEYIFKKYQRPYEVISKEVMENKNLLENFSEHGARKPCPCEKKYKK